MKRWVTRQKLRQIHTHWYPSDTTEAPETDCDRLHEADETALAVSHFSDLHATTSIKFCSFFSLTRLYDRTAPLAGPVFTLMSCSSISASNERVAAVACRSQYGWRKTPQIPQLYRYEKH